MDNNRNYHQIASPLNTPGARLFRWRHLLETNPRAIELCKLTTGLFFNLHFLASCLLFSLYLPLFILPLLFLSLEVIVCCGIVIGLMIRGLVKSEIAMPAWKREAMGRLIRNMIVSFLCCLSLLIGIICFKHTGEGWSISSLSSVLSPVIVLLVIAIFKFIVIRSQHQIALFVLCLSTLTGIVLAIVEVDSQTDLPLIVLWCPLLLNTGVLIHWISRHMYLAYQRKDPTKTLVAVCALVGGVLIIPTSLILLAAAKAKFEISNAHSACIWICAVALAIGLYRNSGELIYDIWFGHVETDLYHYLVPASALKKANEMNALQISDSISIPLLNGT